MRKDELIEMITFLESDDKELIAITPTHVLVYWHSDGTYVSWLYYKTDTSYALELGKYTHADLNPANTRLALDEFSGRSY